MLNRHSARVFLIATSLTMVLLLMGCSSSKPNPDLNLGGIDIGEVFSGLMSRVPHALNGINSMESANKALNELTSVSLDLDDLIFNSQKLSEKGQLDLSMLALKATPEIEELNQMVNESPVFQGKLGGTMEDIVAKLKKLI